MQEKNYNNVRVYMIKYFEITPGDADINSYFLLSFFTMIKDTTKLFTIQAIDLDSTNELAKIFLLIKSYKCKTGGFFYKYN